MNLIALMLVRNEDWVVGSSLRATLRWCDQAVIVDHCSTDATPDILADIQREYPGRVHVVVETDPVWHEQQYRQRSLDEARRHGADFLAIIDADEMLTENLVPTIRDRIGELKPGTILQPRWLCCWRSLRQCRQDTSIWSRSWVSMAFRNGNDIHWQPRTVGKVNDYDFHARAPRGTSIAPTVIDDGGVLHLQHANWQRLLWKQLHYRLIEMIRYPEFGVQTINARYAATSDETNIRLVDLPAHWIPPELATVDVDAESWHKAEVCRLVQEHGREKFAGVDFLRLDIP